MPFFEADVDDSVVYVTQLKFRNVKGGAANTSKYGWNFDGDYDPDGMGGLSPDYKDYISTGGCIRTNSDASGRSYNRLGGQSWGDWRDISDVRTKKNIVRLDLEQSRRFIQNLRPVSFEYKETENNTPGIRHGFIAQEVKEIAGDWAIVGQFVKDGLMSLKYTDIIADLVAVVQDQQKRIEALEARA